MFSILLVRRIVQCLRAVGLPATRPQLYDLALLCYALAFSSSCHLASLALLLPLTGQRESLVQRLRRYLKNPRLSPVQCYAPVMHYILSHWSGREICLVLDRTDIQDRWSILLLGVCYRRRVLPLTWQVLRFGGTGAAEQLPLLQRVQPHLPANIRVCFYADSEFRAIAVQAWCQQYGLHWQIGLHNDLSYRIGVGPWQPLHTLALQPGERRYLQNVYLQQQRIFGPVNLIAYWPPKQLGPRYWALDLPANAQAWRRGRKRYWVEPIFRDWKSYGFDLETTQITDPVRQDKLLLAMALTTLWMTHVGEWVAHNGRSRELDASDRSEYSLFRLGRDYLQRARAVGLRIPVGFSVAGVP